MTATLLLSRQRHVYLSREVWTGLDALISVSSPRVFIFPISVVATRGEGDEGSAGFDAGRGGRG